MWGMFWKQYIFFWRNMKRLYKKIMGANNKVQKVSRILLTITFSWVSVDHWGFKLLKDILSCYGFWIEKRETNTFVLVRFRRSTLCSCEQEQWDHCDWLPQSLSQGEDTVTEQDVHESGWYLPDVSNNGFMFLALLGFHSWRGITIKVWFQWWR